ncbi:MAG TPA: zf-HC2 domain-containing protein [Acidimicrobiales bacterium]
MVAGVPFTCREVLDLLTDFLESALPAPLHARVQRHLADCDDCERHLDQLRATIQALGGLAEDEVAPEVRDQLLNAFRSWPRAGV